MSRGVVSGVPDRAKAMTNGGNRADSGGQPGASASTGDPAEPPRESYALGSIGGLLHRVGWAGAAEIVQLLAVMAAFKVLSDRLSTESYGLLAGALSAAMIAGPLATFGANWTLIREGSVVDNPRSALGRAVSIAGVGTLVGVAVVVAGAALLWNHMPLMVLVPVLLGQMVAFWLVELASTAAVAQAKLKLSAQLRLVGGLIRLGAVASWLLYELTIGADASPVGGVAPSDDLGGLYSWVWFFLAGNIVSAVAVHAIVARVLGGWPSLKAPSLGEFRHGAPYGVGNTTEGFLTASDQVVLTEYDESQNGIYAAGVRIITLGFIPMMALLKAQDRRFFRQGAKGSASSHQAASSMAVHTLAATVPVAIALVLVSPLFSVFISDEFSEAETVIRWLAVLPIIKGVQFSFGNGLTAAGNQGTRVKLTAAVALANLIGNLFLIPVWGWKAAAGTTLVAEVVLMLVLAMASRAHARSGDLPAEPARPLGSDPAPSDSNELPR